MKVAPLPTTLDPPFLAPLECVMDLPFPPSTNRIWRMQRGSTHLSPAYKNWKQQADMAVVANGCWRARVQIPAAFTALILLQRQGRAQDIDNRIKAILDWAQRVEIIRNDDLCQEVTARWVSAAEAPRGARLILRSIA